MVSVSGQKAQALGDGSAYGEENRAADPSSSNLDIHGRARRGVLVLLLSMPAWASTERARSMASVSVFSARRIQASRDDPASAPPLLYDGRLNVRSTRAGRRFGVQARRHTSRSAAELLRREVGQITDVGDPRRRGPEA